MVNPAVLQSIKACIKSSINLVTIYCMSAYRALDELTFVEMQWVNERYSI